MGHHTHNEHHFIHRIGWLRAAVLGANDGIVSTASLLIGFAAAAASKDALLIAGSAGLVAGAGEAGKTKAVVRIVFWGAVAMAVTGFAGKLFGAVV